jgi:hypothetical protein
MEERISGRREDRVTGTLEAQTSRLPSSAFLTAAIGSMAASALLRWAGKKELALFIGEWVPTILIMGVYNKMVKQHGSDSEARFEQAPSRPRSASDYPAAASNF